MGQKSTDEVIADTRPAAIAVLEDLDFLKALQLRKQKTPVELRHASAILRRLLVERQLQRVASPRIGSFNVLTCDNSPFYRVGRTRKMAVFLSCGGNINGVLTGPYFLGSGSRPWLPQGFEPGKTILLGIESFLKQNVIYFYGDWYSRRQVIKFAANVDSGVHSGGAKEDWEKRLADFKYEMWISTLEDLNGKSHPTFGWSPSGLGINVDKYDPGKIGGVLIEISSTIHYLMESPDSAKLMHVLRQEVL